MARLGQQSTDRKTDNGRLYYGDKDAQYLKELSREAVEEHHDSPILYFAIDWERSHKNFYGELLVKKFENPLGVKVRGIYKITQQSGTKTNNIKNVSMDLTVSVYTEQLKELGIDPKPGDYFAVGRRLYRIWKHTIDDAGPGNLIMNREKMRTDYFATQDDDEVLQKDVWGDNFGLEYQINNENGEIIKR